MEAALEQACRAAALDEVPIGAVVMRGDEIVAEAHNETVARRNPTYHAEFLAIERALEALETDRLTDCTLYVTIEPCAQCAGAIVLAKSNMAEWAFSPYETVNSILPGYTRNPYALDRVTAGSSGGTAAAVAASFGLVCANTRPQSYGVV